MKQQSIGLISLVVRDYDEAIAFYVNVVGLVLVEDSAVPEQNKRRVVVAPPRSAGSGLLLARASNDEQSYSYRQPDRWSGVSVSLHGRLRARLSVAEDEGRGFVREPKKEPYGTVAVFSGLYGNVWDLVQLATAKNNSGS